MINGNGKNWIKIVGWLVAGALAVAGWVYAGIMSGYTARIIRLETEQAISRSDIKALQLQEARFEEMFKAINEKLNVLIDQHKR